MRLVARRALTALAIFLGTAFADAAALNSNPACSMDKMERDPSSVIAPCSALLNENDISPEQRAQALFVRGSAYHRTGRPDIAAPDYDEALKLDRNNDEIYIARANAALLLDQHDFAEAVVRVALKINPKNPRALQSPRFHRSAIANSRLPRHCSEEQGQALRADQQIRSGPA